MRKRIISAILATSVLLTTIVPGVFAADSVDPGQTDAVSLTEVNQNVHTDVLLPEASEETKANENTTLSDNMSVAFSFFTQTMGLNNAAASGVIANIYFESKFDPTVYGDGGTSYGICQWHNDRFTNLKNWCAANGFDYTTLLGQLNFLQYELKNGYPGVWNAISSVANSADGAYEAGYVWCLRFEVPADTENKSVERGNYAKQKIWPLYASAALHIKASTDASAYVLGKTAKITAAASSGYQSLHLDINRTTQTGEQDVYYSADCTSATTALTMQESGIYSCTFTAVYADQTLVSNTVEFLVAEHLWDVTLITPATAQHDGLAQYVCSDCGQQKTESITYVPCDGATACSTAHFSDVDQNAWYHEGVDFAVTNYLFSGTTLTKFSPQNTMTRAMFVTVLWRLSGKPESTTVNSFADVRENAYYVSALNWALEKQIIHGMTSTSFAPDGPVTREQMATILYQYAQQMSYDVSQSTSLQDFPDGASTSNYAKTAMQWAVKMGLILGDKTNGRTYLKPKAQSNRAQVATVFMRFANQYE